ncbi:MAG: PH domain-containing protein [Calothrix sp. MO_167.B12]|nr:PH domain-containing protein [Calothrix sp. MO_167.B12]
MNEVFKIIPAPAKALWLIGLFALIMAAVIGLMGYIAYSSRHIQVELSNTELHIKGGLYGRSIPITSLIVNQSQKVDINRGSAYQPTRRSNGTSLPGYHSGWFKLRNGEKALLFVTQSRDVVYLPTTDGYSLLMSVQEPDKFLRSLNSPNI